MVETLYRVRPREEPMGPKSAGLVPAIHDIAAENALGDAGHQNQVRIPNTKRTPLVFSPARRANEAVWPNLPS